MKPIGHLFSLPESEFHLIDSKVDHSSLRVENDGKPLTSHLQSDEAESTGDPSPLTSDEKSADQDTLPQPQCHTCSESEALHLASISEQRVHFKSDWHRYNLKRKLAGKPPIDEGSFEALLGDDRDEISSISGSDSSDEDDELSNRDVKTSNAGAQIILQNTGLPNGKHWSQDRRIAIWKVLLGPDIISASPQTLKERVQELRTDSGIWCVLLSRGGHFAGAIFECVKKIRKSIETTNDSSTLYTIKAHKTFHRYVVRAKAGGKQSGKDATGKFAKSAGSQIRRHNEAALKQEIAEMFQSWKIHFQTVSRIFLAAPGSNELQLYESANPILSKSDPRIRKIPFITNRPTLSEAKRVMTKLLSVYEPEPEIDRLKDDKLKEQINQKKIAQKAKQKSEVNVQTPKISTEEKPPEPELHQAARHGDAELVTKLLSEGHNPTVSVGKTAYAVSSNKLVRDAFRRYMASEPQKWDWVLAGVPSALTPEMEAEQQAKQAEKKERLREKEKQRKKVQAERKKAEKAEAISKAEQEVTAAANFAAAQSKQDTGVSKKVQKSQEELAKRREMMASAAEARMNALKLASQQQTLWSESLESKQ